MSKHTPGPRIGRPPSEKGPRLARLPEPRFYPEEAELIRSVAGYSVSEFIRSAAVEKAKRKVK